MKENGWKVEWMNRSSYFTMYDCGGWKNENGIEKGWWNTLWIVEVLRSLFDLTLTWIVTWLLLLTIDFISFALISIHLQEFTSHPLEGFCNRHKDFELIWWTQSYMIFQFPVSHVLMSKTLNLKFKSFIYFIFSILGSVKTKHLPAIKSEMMGEERWSVFIIPRNT